MINVGTAEISKLSDISGFSSASIYYKLIFAFFISFSLYVVVIYTFKNWRAGNLPESSAKTSFICWQGSAQGAQKFNINTRSFFWTSSWNWASDRISIKFDILFWFVRKKISNLIELLFFSAFLDTAVHVTFDYVASNNVCAYFFFFLTFYFLSNKRKNHVTATITSSSRSVKKWNEHSFT